MHVVLSFTCTYKVAYNIWLWSRGQNKKNVPFHPLGRKTLLLPCIRYTSLVLGKLCLTKISVVSFS